GGSPPRPASIVLAALRLAVGHAPQADARNLQARMPRPAIFHVRSPPWRPLRFETDLRQHRAHAVWQGLGLAIHRVHGHRFADREANPVLENRGALAERAAADG